MTFAALNSSSISFFDFEQQIAAPSFQTFTAITLCNGSRFLSSNRTRGVLTRNSLESKRNTHTRGPTRNSIYISLTIFPYNIPGCTSGVTCINDMTFICSRAPALGSVPVPEGITLCPCRFISHRQMKAFLHMWML